MKFGFNHAGTPLLDQDSRHSQGWKNQWFFFKLEICFFFVFFVLCFFLVFLGFFMVFWFLGLSLESQKIA